MIAECRQAEPRRFGALRLAFLVWLALACGMGLRAEAETQAPALPAVLTAVSATTEPDGEMLVLLAFQPIAPRFSIINNDSTNPAIALALSSRGLSATAPQGLHGLLRSVVFDQQGAVEI